MSNICMSVGADKVLEVKGGHGDGADGRQRSGRTVRSEPEQRVGRLDGGGAPNTQPQQPKQHIRRRQGTQTAAGLQ